MSLFFFINDREVRLEDPAAMLKEEYFGRFGERTFRRLILSEICVLDMLYMVMDLEDGYYKQRLSLKGGLSVRSAMSVADHRFSFDADFDPNTPGGFTYGDVCELKKDIVRYGETKRCKTPVRLTRNDAQFCFIEIGYRKSLENYYQIMERPKIEVCKNCQVIEKPVLGPINTIIDLERMNLKPPMVAHLTLEEQFATKMFVIGARGRQRNQFDAYDSFRIHTSNQLDMKKARSIFKRLCERHHSSPHDYTEKCRKQLDTMLGNRNKKRQLEEIVLAGDFDYDEMISRVKSFYDF